MPFFYSDQTGTTWQHPLLNHYLSRIDAMRAQSTPAAPTPSWAPTGPPLPPAPLAHHAQMPPPHIPYWPAQHGQLAPSQAHPYQHPTYTAPPPPYVHPVAHMHPSPYGTYEPAYLQPSPAMYASMGAPMVPSSLHATAWHHLPSQAVASHPPPMTPQHHHPPPMTPQHHLGAHHPPYQTPHPCCQGPSTLPPAQAAHQPTHHYPAATPSTLAGAERERNIERESVERERSFEREASVRSQRGGDGAAVDGREESSAHGWSRGYSGGESGGAVGGGGHLVHAHGGVGGHGQQPLGSEQRRRQWQRLRELQHAEVERLQQRETA